MTVRARFSRAARGHALDLEGKADIAENGEMRQQGEVLEDHAHAMAADLDHFASACREKIAAVEQNLAGRRLDQARHAADERRLARAGQAHDDEDFSVMDIEGNVADGAR